MTVRVEVVTPCPHGEYRIHQIQGEGDLVLRVCDDISRRSFTEWPPETIEAARRAYYESVYEDDFEAALAAAWEILTGDNK